MEWRSTVLRSLRTRLQVTCGPPTLVRAHTPTSVVQMQYGTARLGSRVDSGNLRGGGDSVASVTTHSKSNQRSRLGNHLFKLELVQRSQIVTGET